MAEENIQTSKEKKEDERGFEVQLEAFSGPLDLLCHLVDIREMDPIKLNLTDLVTQYVQFLLKSKRTDLNQIAEFFSFASRLILHKVRSLFPSQRNDEDVQEDEPLDDELTEEELQQMLENFRPYRAAAARLAKFQQDREQYFVRIVDEDSTPFYDLGDLYSLASRWWSLLDEYNRRTESESYGEDDFIDDIPDAIPEERQVDQRMEELMEIVKGKHIKLRELLTERSRKTLIVTLLALLEMSRLGMIDIIQTEVLGDVEIVAA